MPPGYTAQQKAAIQQFMSFASTDQKTAVKVSAGEDVLQAQADGGVAPQECRMGSFRCCEHVSGFFLYDY